MKRVEINALFAEPARYTAEPVTVCGWVRTLRSSKALGFIELNDGSYFSNLQVVFEDNKLANFDEISRQNVGAALYALTMGMGEGEMGCTDAIYKNIDTIREALS